MIDKTELKRLAEACGDLNWRAIQENWCELAIRDDHAYIATMRTKSAKHAGPCPDREAKAKFLCAVTPAVVLALIMENERLSGECEGCPMQVAEELRRQVDQLKAENEALRKNSDRYEFLRRLPDGDAEKYLGFANEDVTSQMIDEALDEGDQP